MVEIQKAKLPMCPAPLSFFTLQASAALLQIVWKEFHSEYYLPRDSSLLFRESFIQVVSAEQVSLPP